MATQEELEKARLQQVQKPKQQGQYTNLEGISDASRNNLNYYGQGYQPSSNVQAAQDYLRGVIEKQPGTYQSSYADQIKGLYDQVMARPKFVYDVNKDPLFKSYKDQYIVNGQRAMQDTIGNAAALTGGYGNSWGTTAGYQAYQAYLQQLNNVIPELEQRAFDRYGAEGDQLKDNLSLALTLENTDYGRHRDQLGDWQTDRAFAQDAYEDAADRDRADWQNMLAYYQNLANMENADYWTRQNYDFDLRQYEDALARASGGGGSGSGGSYQEAAEEPTAAEEDRFRINLPTNQALLAQGIGNGVLLPATSQTYTKEEANELLDQIQAQYDKSFGKAAANAARQANLSTANPYPSIRSAYVTGKQKQKEEAEKLAARFPDSKGLIDFLK